MRIGGQAERKAFRPFIRTLLSLNMNAFDAKICLHFTSSSPRTTSTTAPTRPHNTLPPPHIPLLIACPNLPRTRQNRRNTLRTRNARPRASLSHHKIRLLQPLHQLQIPAPITQVRQRPNVRHTMRVAREDQLALQELIPLSFVERTAEY